MNDTLQIVLVAVSLVLALAATVYVVRDRAIDRWLIAGWALLEVGLLVQLVVGIALLSGTERDVDGLTFVGYLVGCLLVPPAAVVWALGERSRAGTAVLIAAGVVVPFLLLRLGQIWTAPAL